MGMTMDWSKIGCIQEPPVQVRKAEPLARHTSFRIGGPADYMAFPASQAQLAFLLRTALRMRGLMTLRQDAAADIAKPPGAPPTPLATPTPPKPHTLSSGPATRNTSWT